MEQHSKIGETTSGSNVQSNNNSPKSNKWLIAALALSLAGNGYMYYSKDKTETRNEFLINENTDISAAKDTLQNQYDAALARLDELTGKNAAMDEMLKEKDAELSKIKNDIKALLHKSNVSIADLKKAQSLIGALNTRVKSYQEQIADLELENANLTTANDELSKDNKNAHAEAARLKKLGSVLHISNIKLEAINQKHNGEKEVSTSRARKADLLRVIFDIDENRIMESGLNEIFVVIQDPDGNIMSNAAYGSGNTTDANGATLNYTIVKKINLEKNQKMTNVNVDWKQDNSFPKGDYHISFYNGGYKIGEGSVHLK